MSDEQAGESVGSAGGGLDLEAGLLTVPGCLGVETATTPNGKDLLFAWFEDKAAVLRWYYSAMHQEIQDQTFPDRPPHEPLSRIPEDSGPIMAIASLTWAETPSLRESTFPIAQIAIELYKPLPGGVLAGGRFAPDALDVEGMLGYSWHPQD